MDNSSVAVSTHQRAEAEAVEVIDKADIHIIALAKPRKQPSSTP